MATTEEQLGGQVAIVTGAGRGIGKAIAQAYAKAGAAVCCAARTVPEIQATVQEIEATGGRALAVPADVTRIAAVQNMVQATVDTFGGLDILVINAGAGGERNSVEESDPERWCNTVELNLFGAYHCARAAIPALKKRGGGKIIAIGSGMGHRGTPGASAYSCAKAGLWMLTRVLAQELMASNISVNELSPGPVLTRNTAAIAAQGRGTFGIEGEWVKRPEDVIPLALFLATQPAVGPTAQSYSLMRRDW